MGNSSKNSIDSRLRTAAKYLILDGVYAHVMVTLTGGAFLVAFAIGLGASNLVIGLLAAIGPLSQLLQIPGVILVERVRRRKAITLVMASISRLCWLFIAAIPFLFGVSGTALLSLIILLFISSAFGAVAGSSWQPWIRDLIPERAMGKVFSVRLRYGVAAAVTVSIIAAVFVDLWARFFPPQVQFGYSILFVFGFMAGAFGIYQIFKIPDIEMEPPEHAVSIIKLLKSPFADENFRNLMIFLCSWGFAVNLAAPFFMVYMLRRLGLSMSAVIALGVLSQIMTIIFLKIWGKYTSRYSNKSVLVICGPLFIFAILAWTFTTMPERYVLTVPLLICIHAVMGISTAGVSLASLNITYKLAPKGKGTAYLATNTICTSMAAGIAPILGGRFADSFALRELSWTLEYTSPTGVMRLMTLNLQQWDFFFILAFVLGIYSIHRLSLIKETGIDGNKIIMQELFTQMRGQVRVLSSAEGLRQMVTMPANIFKGLLGTKAADKTEDSPPTPPPTEN